MASPDSGKDALFKIFYHFYCLSDQVSKDRIPRRNDFSNIQQYFVQCELPAALAKIRMSSGIGSPVPMVVRDPYSCSGFDLHYEL